MFLFLSFLIFSAALLAAGYYVWTVPQRQEAQLMNARLRELRARSGTRTRVMGNDLMRREARGTFAFLGDFVQWVGLLRRLQQIIEQANLKYRAHDVFALCLILTACTFVVLGLTGMSMLALRLLLSLAAGLTPVLLILRVRRRRLAKFEENFPDAIDLFNRSMKAGHTIHSGLETIATETFDPVRMEFKKVTEELSLGSALDEALRNLGDRVPVIDLRFFVIALNLQRQTGANLVDVLDNLAALVRERLNMAARVKAHTAQQRLSAGLLCALPFIVGLGFWFVKPEYINLLFTDPTGTKFLTYAVVSETIGILIIRKLANPRF